MLSQRSRRSALALIIFALAVLMLVGHNIGQQAPKGQNDAASQQTSAQAGQPVVAVATMVRVMTTEAIATPIPQPSEQNESASAPLAGDSQEGIDSQGG